MSNTPQKFAGCLRLCPTENSFGGDPVCACGCVNASQKCGRSPRFAFLRVTPKLSCCSLIFAPRNQRVFLYAVGGFLPVADASAKGEYRSPSFRGPHKIACGDFAGSPIRAFLPHCVTARARLCGGVNFAAHLSRGCSFSPSEYTFGGDPLESAVLLKCGICFSSF